MTSGARDDAPFYLQGNFAPVNDEVTAFDLEVQGAIPPELQGLYVRNGPNPRAGDAGHWFLGDGMVHGVRLESGRARWYRNRYVRTRYIEEPGVKFVRANGKVDRTVAKANTHVVAHAGRLFALVESSFPTELGPELNTVGTEDFDGHLSSAFTAHPKTCPLSGELHAFGYGFAPPYLTYFRLNREGNLVKQEVVPVKGATMMHDFAITAGHVIFLDLPIVFSVKRALARKGFPYVWSDDYGARIGVMPRSGSALDTRWFDIEPCYVFHVFNAWEDGSVVGLDVARYPELWRGTPDSFSSAFAHRFEIDLDRGCVSESALDERPVEFPRIDDRRTGLRHRLGYAVSTPKGPDELAGDLIKYDFATGSRDVHALDSGCTAGEGVFAPAGDATGEDEGWVLAYVYDASRDSSELVIIDAARLSAPPVARVALPQRVPFGFHGSWIPDG